MFTLHVPIVLPPGHSFFDNGQYPVPPLPGNLIVSSVAHENAPLFLSIAGFQTEPEARDFWPTLRASLLWATLQAEHSMAIDTGDVVTADKGMFDGSRPTVFATGGPTPYYASGSAQHGLHISVLSNYLNDGMGKGLSAKLKAKAEVALALELFSGFQFAGTRNSQFVVLFSALEVMETKSTKKRGATIKRVKDALSKIGHPDPKFVGKRLDKLYENRNDLIHEALPISDAQLSELAEIVRSTLKALLS
jgi:hypothetical protein